MNRLTYTLLTSLLWMISLLPLRTARAVGVAIGEITWWLNNSIRRVTEENLRICFADMPEHERRLLARRHLHHLGMAMMELGLVWSADPAVVMRRIVRVTGQRHLDKALAHGKGVIILAPHIGNWEAVGLYLADQFPITNMYQPPDNPALDTLIQKVRKRNGSTLVPTNTSGVKAQLRALKRGELVGVLPDQVPPLNSGDFAPFFGTPALTITMVHSLIQRTGARAVFSFARCLPGSGDFEIVFQPADEELYSDDEVTSLTALNRGVEAAVVIAPEQYQWEYKRFKKQPGGERKYYRH